MDDHGGQPQAPECVKTRSHRRIVIAVAVAIVIAVVLTVLILKYGSCERPLFQPDSEISPLNDSDEYGSVEDF